MPKVVLRQTNQYPVLSVRSLKEGEVAGLTVNLPRGPVAVYETAQRALLIAELEVLKAAEDQLREAVDVERAEGEDTVMYAFRTHRAAQLLRRIEQLTETLGMGM
jgi:hypothetical protein